MRDPYTVLGLSRSASSQQVKQAYKKLALRWHPDLCAAKERSEAEAAFKDITAAYTRIIKGSSAPGTRPRYATQPYGTQPGAKRMSGSEPSPRFTNMLVAFCLCVPLVLTGVQFGKTFPKWEEQSWRRHGIMSPPVNPWLKDEHRATEFSHLKRWQSQRDSTKESQDGHSL